MPSEDTCNTCRFFRPPPPMTPAIERGGVIPSGFCQRYPTAVPKRPYDQCGEFVHIEKGDANA